MLISSDPEHQVQFGNSRPTPVYALVKNHPRSGSSDSSNHNLIRRIIQVKTVPGRGYVAGVRLYSPTKAFFDKTWKPDGVGKVGGGK